MNKDKIKKEEIDLFLKEATSRAGSTVKAIRLKAFNRVCEELVKKSVQLKIKLVVQYMNETGYKMSSQSIYNKQKGENPYRILFDLWFEYDTLKRSALKPTIKVQSSFDHIIDDEDLRLIDDPVLRYQISLMYGQLKGLKKQNDLMKQVQEMNIVHSVPEHLIESRSASSYLLNDYEIEILKEFVSSGSDLVFNDEGALIANLPIRKGKLLSNQGLKEALSKVLRSYMLDGKWTVKSMG